MKLLLSPSEVVRLVEQGYQELEQLVGLVPRAIALLDQAEQLLTRVDGLVDRIELTDARANRVVTEAEVIVGETAIVVAQAGQLTSQVTAMVTPVEPAVQRLTPLVNQVAGSVTVADADAMTRLVHDLPAIVGTLERDILPVLDTLGTVAPDLRDLLDVSRDLNELLAALPGLGRVKRRLDDDEHEREYLADEELSTAPDRGGDTHPAGNDGSNSRLQRRNCSIVGRIGRQHRQLVEALT